MPYSPSGSSLPATVRTLPLPHLGTHSLHVKLVKVK